MKRAEGWEARFKRVVEAHRDLPSVYGTSDCFQICNDTVMAVTGDYLFDGLHYHTELGAARILKRLGFANVEEMFASKLETIPPALAQRGDIGVMLNDKNEPCGGVFTALGFMVRDAKSIQFVSVANVKTAFKVGR